MNRMWLKWIALITMTFDHIGFFLIPESSPFYILFRLIGRIAFPIFAFMIAEGYIHTKDKMRYFLRLSSMAIVVEAMFLSIFLIYDVNYTLFSFLGNQVARFNIMPTLMLGFLGIHVLNRYPKYGWLLMIPMLFISYVLSYGFYGFLIIVGFGFFRSLKHQMVAFVTLTVLNSYLTIFIPIEGFYGVNYIQLFSIAAVLFLYSYNGAKGKYPLKFFYLYYPVHIVTLFLISYYV